MVRWEKSFAALLLISAAIVGPAHGQEQDYPQRPIRIVVGFGPGSGADTIARIVADKLSETFKAGVVVENKEGAGSAIAGTFVARAAPDGYTLLLGATTMTVSPHMQASKPYNAVEDFIPVVRLAELPLLLVAAPTAPYKNLKEMIAYAKAHPGQLNYATSGKGTPSHLGIELISRATGIDMRDVPYKNGGQAMTDTLSGQVSVYFPGFPAALPQVLGKKAQALAIGAKARSDQLPDVPTVEEETGKQGLEVITWYGLFAPVGTPRAVVDILYRETVKVLQSPQTQAQIRKSGAEVAMATPQAFAEEVRSDNAKYERLIRELGLIDK